MQVVVSLFQWILRFLNLKKKHLPLVYPMIFYVKFGLWLNQWLLRRKCEVLARHIQPSKLNQKLSLLLRL